MAYSHGMDPSEPQTLADLFDSVNDQGEVDTLLMRIRELEVELADSRTRSAALWETNKHLHAENQSLRDILT